MREWTAKELNSKAHEFWESCILHAAVKIDIFTKLSESDLTIPQLANVMQSSERGVELLVNALCGMELLARDGNQIKLNDASRHFLCTDSPSYMGAIIKHGMDNVARFNKLSDCVKSGDPVQEIMTDSTPEDLESFIMGMKDAADAQANLIVPCIDLSGCKRFLDFGGATGAYAIHFCKANPNVEAVVYDLPTSKPFADKVIHIEQMEDRVSFVAGDFLKDDVPTGFDVVWVSQIIHSFNEEDSKIILKKAANALNPGGRIFVQEFFMNNDFQGPLFPSLFGITMLLNCAGGATYSRKQVAEWMQPFGIDEIHSLDIALPNSTGIICGVKK